MTFPVRYTVGVTAVLFLFAATAESVTLNVDVSASRKPISPFIYGLNFTKPAFATEIGLPVRRWGGNSTSRYNWNLNAFNHGVDWFFHNNAAYDAYTGNTQTADQWITENNTTGAQSLITLPMIGYVSKNIDQFTCGFLRVHYPNQDEFDTDDGFPDCGNGLNGGVPIVNNPLDTSITADQTFAASWVTHLTATHGAAASGGVKFYELDNEPGIWESTHRDVHPNGMTYDESYNKGSAWAAAVKAVDPNALILGPVQDGWTRYFYASYPGDGSTAIADRNNHGGTEFVTWYLQQMSAYEQAHPGHRLLDYLDLHFYPQNGVDQSPAGDATNQALRLRSTRALWDPTYVDESWIADAGPYGGIVRLIPRMRDWVNGSYPNTKLALTEYNFGGLESINGALAQADILGIFGREGLDLATLWAYPSQLNGSGQEIDYDTFETLPGAYAFRMFRNYDGAGAQFGDTSVSAVSSDQSQLSVYAAQRTTDSSLMLMIVNKTMTSSVTGTVSIASNFVPAASAQVYRYSDANLNAILSLAGQPVSGGGFSATFPANSITLVRIPTAAPTVVTGAAGTITATAATLNGTANPNATSTTGHFRYGPTTGYGTTTPDQSLGSGSNAVAVGGGSISGLTCNAVYHFQTVATNAGGTTFGSDQTFTTGACTGFTDDPLVAGSTSVKAVHITELRSRIDALRVHFGLAAFAWTDTNLSGVAAKVVHVAQLRTALNSAYDAAITAGKNVTRPSYTNDPLTAGQTAIKAVHISELRADVVNLEAHP
ncbi:MAG TPA: glycoside hydrolase family 44 protein [Thermoanaerobaculia bacterium]|jgi:hypothetical protein